jgi:hypothetical protein
MKFGIITEAQVQKGTTHAVRDHENITHAILAGRAPQVSRRQAWVSRIPASHLGRIVQTTVLQQP